MTVYRIVLAAIAAVALVAVAPEANGKGGTPITTCAQVVTQSAFLTQDLYCPGSAGVVIGASGITIDLKGFMLRGDRSAGHYGVDDQGGFDQLTVRNGVVRNFYLGVAAFNFADKVVVSGVLASGNVIAGISLSGFSDSVKSSTGSGNGDTGIAVGGTGGAKVQSSTASGNGSYGINAGGASASVKSSTATGNGILGINIDGPSASLISSIASGNGEGGISVNGDATQIKGNRAEANGFAGGSSDLAGLGIVAFGYTKAPVGTNIARGNDDTAECNPAFLC